MNNIIEVFLATLFVPILAAVISIITTNSTIRSTGFHYVSSERTKWIYRVRELYARLSSLYIMYEYYGVLSEDNHKEFNMACEELKVILNDSINGKYPADNRVIELITSLQSNVNSTRLSQEDRNSNKKNNTETILDELNSLQKVIRIILKGEWDKVKVESGDSYKKQRKVDSIQHKVDKKYYLLCISSPTEKQRNTVIRHSH